MQRRAPDRASTAKSERERGNGLRTEGKGEGEGESEDEGAEGGANEDEGEAATSLHTTTRRGPTQTPHMGCMSAPCVA